jgi:hypothetical protein
MSTYVIMSRKLLYGILPLLISCDRDINVNLAFQKKSFKVIRAAAESVYLNDTELKKILKLKLSPAMEKLRDIFVMACYVGARHSDWHQISIW